MLGTPRPKPHAWYACISYILAFLHILSCLSFLAAITIMTHDPNDTRVALRWSFVCRGPERALVLASEALGLLTTGLEAPFLAQ